MDGKMLERQNVIYKADNREVLYHSILKCPDGIIRMYCNRWTKDYKTVYKESKDGIKFGDEMLAVGDSGASHNFYPFIHDNKVFAIGGVDSWKLENRWKSVDTFEKFKKMYLERFREEYTKDAYRFEEFKAQRQKKPSFDHTSGLYLFKSDVGKKWNTVKSDPIITTLHPGFNSALKFGKSSEFDGHLSLLWNNKYNLWFIYNRNNIRPKYRYIQFAVSKDLFTWSKYRNIKIDIWNSKVDNYYSPVFIKHPEIELYIGLLPYYKNKVGCIKVVTSNDGENFVFKKELFTDSVMLLQGAQKNRVQFVNGYIRSGDDLFFYMHENYLGLDKKKPVEIVRYKISIKDFNKMINI